MVEKIPVEGGPNAEGRVSSRETPAAAAQAGVPPTPGGEQEVKEVWIDLEDLYLTVSGPAAAAAEVLKALLGAWGVEYAVLYNASDAGIEYFDREFERVAKKYEKEHVRDDWLFLAARDFAREKGARAVVILYDGYEDAAAVVFDGDC